MLNNKSKGPLLYIHQPFARTPATKMQDVYTSKQEPELLEEEKPIPIQKEETRTENPQTTFTKTLQEKRHSTLNRVKPFKEMNIKERLDYLNNYPIVLPPPPCVFITDKKNYQGYLTEYDGHEATIRFHDQTTKTVPVIALKNVILIGLKK
ncbi:CotO family spore coat protein [Neobacillus drentensis]|uniref:CotO family spore coat protein n=1 Tax=Neobacillus drentensis TaxID=220684 RepID=UPI002FFE3D1C